MTGRVEVLGVPFDRVTLAGAADRVEGFMAGGRPSLVVTPNPEVVMAARGNPTLMEALRGAALAVADGVGIVWAARRVGLPVPERVTGADLLTVLLERCARGGYRVFFLGARPGVAERAAARARDMHPGLVICGTHDGYFSPDEDPLVISVVRQARPHLLVTAMGFPRDQLWAWQHLPELGVPAVIGVGGSLDVMAGEVVRAPVWMRRLGLEWSYRLLRQPSRARRMLALPRFVRAVNRSLRQKSLMRG